MKALLIYNPNSGRGQILKDLPTIEVFFGFHKIPLRLYQVKDALDLIEEVKVHAKEVDAILIAGGDGTVHTVMNALMQIKKEFRPKILILPYGTTNDTAYMLGITKKLKETLALVLTDSVHEMDLYKANDSYFVYAAAIGKFSKVSYEINRQSLRWLGPLGYFINTLRDLFNHYKMDVIVRVDDKVIDRKTFLILMVAGKRVAGFKLDKFTNHAKLNDGYLGVRIFTRNHMFSWFKMVWFYLFKGRHFKNDLHLQVKKIDFEISNEYTWNIDGEKGPGGHLSVEVVEKPIQVYVNPNDAKTLF